MLQRYNIASKEYWVRQYDHEVQGRTILKPFDGLQNDAPMNAAVIKPKYSSKRGLVISNGICPRYSDVDTYWMAASAVDEAVRNIVATGGDPLTMVGLDNFCWPDPVYSKSTPDGQYKLAQLVRACKGLKDICTSYDLPLISGKDSMKNDYGEGENKISIPPTLLFTAVAKIDNVEEIMTSHFKKTSSLIYQLGETKSELGASEWLDEYSSILDNNVIESVPKVDPKWNFALYQKLHDAIKKKIILSCHDISDGGFIIALSESAFGGMIGCDVHLDFLPKKLSLVEKLYSESNGRFIVEIEKSNEKTFLSYFKNFRFYRVGTTNIFTKLAIYNGDKKIIDSDLKSLKEKWKEGTDILKNVIKNSTGVKTLLFTGYGINSDWELAECFRRAGSFVERKHINEIIANKKIIFDFHIIAIPGGFSFWRSHFLWKDFCK